MFSCRKKKRSYFSFHVSDVLILFYLGVLEEFLIKSLNGRSLDHDSMTSPRYMSVNPVLVSPLTWDKVHTEPDLTHISELVLSSEMSGLVIKHWNWKVTVAELLNFSLWKRPKSLPIVSMIMSYAVTSGASLFLLLILGVWVITHSLHGGKVSKPWLAVSQWWFDLYLSLVIWQTLLFRAT